MSFMCIGCIGFGIGTGIWHVYYMSNCKQCGVLNMFDFLPFWSILVRIFFVCQCMDRAIQNVMLGCVKVSRATCMRVRLILLTSSDLLQPRQRRRFAAFGRCLKIWHASGILSCIAATEFFTSFLTCEVEKCFEASTIGEHAKELEGKRAQLVDAVLGQPGDVNSC